MGNTGSGISKWLTPAEAVVYDSKSDNIAVNNERDYHAFVTSKRAIFLQADKVQEVTHNLVASISWQRTVHWGLLSFGIVLIAIGFVVRYYFNASDFSPIAGFDKIFSDLLVAAGVIAIIIFVFHRPEQLQIYSAGRPLTIDGPRQKLKEIMFEIRNQQTLQDERRSQLGPVTGEDIPQSVGEAIKQLKLRLAKGEISEAEYMKLKKTIES